MPRFAPVSQTASLSMSQSKRLDAGSGSRFNLKCVPRTSLDPQTQSLLEPFTSLLPRNSEVFWLGAIASFFAGL